MIFTDSVPVSGVRRTADGYLVAEAFVARTGIQDYLGSEIDPNNEHGLRDVPIVKVYRPESSVFHKDAMNSYAYRPMTNDHPGGDGRHGALQGHKNQPRAGPGHQCGQGPGQTQRHKKKAP